MDSLSTRPAPAPPSLEDPALRARVALARGEVLEAAQRMLQLGLVVAVWGNVSARVRGSGLVVITPSGVDYDRLVADDLSVLEAATGARVEGRLKPSSELRTHLAVYRQRPDVGGVVHTHSLYASAFAVAHRSIPPIVEDAAQVVGGSVECAVYGAPGTQDLADKAVLALGPRGAVLLANHGVVGVGPTVAEALRVCQIVEKTAHIHALACRLGEPVLLSDAQVAELHHSYCTSYGQK